MYSFHDNMEAITLSQRGHVWTGRGMYCEYTSCFQNHHHAQQSIQYDSIHLPQFHNRDWVIHHFTAYLTNTTWASACKATVSLTILPQVLFAVFGCPQHHDKQLLLWDPASLQRPIDTQHLVALISGVEEDLFKQDLNLREGKGRKLQERNSSRTRRRQLTQFLSNP